MRIRTILVTALLSIVPGTAAAAIYAGTGNEALTPGMVITLDPTNALGSALPGSTAGEGITGLAFHPGGRLFGATRVRFSSVTTLREYDPVTGAPLALAVPVLDGVSNVMVTDLAFQPGAGLLFAVDTGGRLYTIDLLTGSAQFKGDTQKGRGGLAFSPTGALYMTSSSGLHVIDPTTAAVLSTTMLGTFYDGLAVDPQTGLLWGTGGATDDRVQSIHPVTGAETLIGNVVLGKISDLDFQPQAIPEPQTMLLAAAALGLIALGRRRSIRNAALRRGRFS
jgi:MYXO-CTERM domain-containing protein